MRRRFAALVGVLLCATVCAQQPNTQAHKDAALRQAKANREKARASASDKPNPAKPKPSSAKPSTVKPPTKASPPGFKPKPSTVRPPQKLSNQGRPQPTPSGHGRVPPSPNVPRSGAKWPPGIKNPVQTGGAPRGTPPVGKGQGKPWKRPPGPYRFENDRADHTEAHDTSSLHVGRGRNKTETRTCITQHCDVATAICDAGWEEIRFSR